MKSNQKNKKTGSGMLMCQECGQKYSQVEFHHGINLCDHLALDAVALKLEKTRRRPKDLGAVSATPVVQKAEAPHCPRCRGLMVSEQYIDWECHGDFEGWRCLSCGNVWDGIIAENRNTVDQRKESQLTRRFPRQMIHPMSVRQTFGSLNASIRK